MKTENAQLREIIADQSAVLRNCSLELRGAARQFRIRRDHGHAGTCQSRADLADMAAVDADARVKTIDAARPAGAK